MGATSHRAKSNANTFCCAIRYFNLTRNTRSAPPEPSHNLKRRRANTQGDACVDTEDEEVLEEEGVTREEEEEGKEEAGNEEENEEDEPVSTMTWSTA